MKSYLLCNSWNKLAKRFTRFILSRLDWIWIWLEDLGIWLDETGAGSNKLSFPRERPGRKEGATQSLYIYNIIFYVPVPLYKGTRKYNIVNIERLRCPLFSARRFSRKTQFVWPSPRFIWSNPQIPQRNPNPTRSTNYKSSRTLS